MPGEVRREGHGLIIILGNGGERLSAGVSKGNMGIRDISSSVLKGEGSYAIVGSIGF